MPVLIIASIKTVFYHACSYYYLSKIEACSVFVTIRREGQRTWSSGESAPHQSFKMSCTSDMFS